MFNNTDIDVTTVGERIAAYVYISHNYVPNSCGSRLSTCVVLLLKEAKFHAMQWNSVSLAVTFRHFNVTNLVLTRKHNRKQVFSYYVSFWDFEDSNLPGTYCNIQVETSRRVLHCSAHCIITLRKECLQLLELPCSVENATYGQFSKGISPGPFGIDPPPPPPRKAMITSSWHTQWFRQRGIHSGSDIVVCTVVQTAWYVLYSMYSTCNTTFFSHCGILYLVVNSLLHSKEKH
jgi:hypothetical protein